MVTLYKPLPVAYTLGSFPIPAAAISKRSGYERSYVHMVLTGQRSPSPRALKAIADAIGVDMDELWEYLKPLLEMQGIVDGRGRGKMGYQPY